MTEEQAERLIAAVASVADATRAVAVVVEDQTGVLNDIHRRLAEIAEVAEGPAPSVPKGRRKAQ